MNFMRDHAPKSYLRDPAPTRADLVVLTVFAIALVGLLVIGWVKP